MQRVLATLSHKRCCECHGALWLWVPEIRALGEGVCAHVCWGEGEDLAGRRRKQVTNRLKASN